MKNNRLDEIDRGEMTSRENGNLTRSMVELAEKGMEDRGAATVEFADEIMEKGSVPNTVKNQNLGHNSKKEGLGPNTKR